MSEFIKTIHSCIAAAVPCIAVSTTETEEVVKQITEYAAKHTHRLKGQNKDAVFLYGVSLSDLRNMAFMPRLMAKRNKLIYCPRK